jgi:two-component system chemotaxis sensor kinase CheA
VDELTKEFLAESQEALERMELCVTELEKRPGDGELVSEIFRTVHTIKGTTSFLGFNRLQALAHTGESLLVALRDGKIAVTCELISGLLNLLDRLREILRLIENTGTEGARSTDDDRELLALLARLKTASGELFPNEEPTRQSRDVVHMDSPSDLPGKDQTLRIDVDVLNRMMDLVGELVLTRNQIVQSTPGAHTFPDLALRLSNVTSELRESVRQARMQSLGHLFGKFPRMVRDLAAVCGRNVRIEFEGQETRLDKTLLEAIRDPLAHAVRNSVDHGIEPAETRVLKGKPAEGVVRLCAFQHNGSIVIEVIDDGAGISTGRVLAKAIEGGLITPEQASSMTEREVLQMIFVAGFSTAKKVTNVSGRGVGMDVVRANVEKVGGSVEVESRAGLGTTVRLRVPLTLAIIPALVVQSGGQSFVLPQSSLIELVYVPTRDATAAIERIGATELYRLREELLPLVRLCRLLELEQRASTKRHGFYVAVLESEGLRFGLAVDDLGTSEEIVVKPLSGTLGDIGLFSGATVLGNGSMAMILDVAVAGARAGIRPAADTMMAKTGPGQGDAARVEAAGLAAERSMVIYESRGPAPRQGGNPARIGIPLSAVERIERVPLGSIEYAEGRAVLQYGGELLPLQDDDAVLPALGAAANAMVTVLICLRPQAHTMRRVGMVVRRVLGISTGVLLSANEDLYQGRLAMVDSRVTTVHREFAREPRAEAAVLQEVA